MSPWRLNRAATGKNKLKVTPSAGIRVQSQKPTWRWFTPTGKMAMNRSTESCGDTIRPLQIFGRKPLDLSEQPRHHGGCILQTGDPDPQAGALRTGTFKLDAKQGSFEFKDITMRPMTDVDPAMCS